MMPNVVRGERMGGLLSYLAGEGRRNEHTEPHLVNGDSATYTFYGDAELDRATALEIGRVLDEPRTAFGVEVPGGHVWHCSLSLRAEEGQLGDEQWSTIAQQFVDRMGFTEASGKSQCRWVAVRHGLSARGNDHIHIAVNLVREDGTKASIHHDYSRAQKIARELEQEHGLQVLESRGSDMAMRGERPGERAAADRRGESTIASVKLERTVRASAAASTDEAEFVRRLHQGGVIMRPRFAADRDDVVAGYSVALRPKPGEPIVWYGGGRLARDLTLPRLRQGWEDTPKSAQGAVDEWRATWRNPMRYTPVAPGKEQHEPGPELWREYTDQVAGMREQLRQIDPNDRVSWAQAARETSGAFAAWSQRLETEPGPLADAARTLACTSQIRARDAAPRRNSSTLRSIAGVASLMAMASTGGQGTMAEAMLFRQLMRTAQAIHDMHRAVQESRRAAEIRDALGDRLNTVRERLPELVAAAPAGRTSDPVQRATSGVAPAQPGNPLPTPLQPYRPTTPTGRPTTPKRGTER